MWVLEGRVEGSLLTELEVLAVAWAKNWGVAMLAMFMLYGWRLGDVWLAGDGC